MLFFKYIFLQIFINFLNSGQLNDFNNIKKQVLKRSYFYQLANFQRK